MLNQRARKFELRLINSGIDLGFYYANSGSAYFTFNNKSYRISNHKQVSGGGYKIFNINVDGNNIESSGRCGEIDIDIYPKSGENLTKLLAEICKFYKKKLYIEKKNPIDAIKDYDLWNEFCEWYNIELYKENSNIARTPKYQNQIRFLKERKNKNE